MSISAVSSPALSYNDLQTIVITIAVAFFVVILLFVVAIVTAVVLYTRGLYSAYTLLYASLCDLDVFCIAVYVPIYGNIIIITNAYDIYTVMSPCSFHITMRLYILRSTGTHAAVSPYMTCSIYSSL